MSRDDQQTITTTPSPGFHVKHLITRHPLADWPRVSSLGTEPPTAPPLRSSCASLLSWAKSGVPASSKDHQVPGDQNGVSINDLLLLPNPKNVRFWAIVPDEGNQLLSTLPLIRQWPSIENQLEMATTILQNREWVIMPWGPPFAAVATMMRHESAKQIESDVLTQIGSGMLGANSALLNENYMLTKDFDDLSPFASQMLDCKVYLLAPQDTTCEISTKELGYDIVPIHSFGPVNLSSSQNEPTGVFAFDVSSHLSALLDVLFRGDREIPAAVFPKSDNTQDFPEILPEIYSRKWWEFSAPPANLAWCLTNVCIYDTCHVAIGNGFIENLIGTASEKYVESFM